MTRKVLVGAALLCLAALVVQYFNHEAQRSAVGRVLAGRLLDLNLVGEQRFRDALATDLRALDLDLAPHQLSVRRRGHHVRVEIRWERRVVLGPLSWPHALQVERDTVDLGI